MDYSTFLIWVSSILLLINLLQHARKKAKMPTLPPGPPPLPIIGNLFELGDKPHESLTELAKTHGPLMTLKLGSVTTVVVSSAAMAEEVLQNKDRFLSGRKIVDATRALNFNESSMAWSQPNQYWRKLRAISKTQLFSNQILDAGQGLRHHKVRELIANMLEKSAAREAVDIGKAAFVTAINLIANSIFSTNVVDMDSEFSNEFYSIVWGFMEESGKPNLVDYFPMLRPLDPQGVRRHMKAHLKKAFETIDGMIDRRLLHGGTSTETTVTNDFLDALLDQNSGLTRQQARSLIWELFAAGSDTSSSTVEWALTELLLNKNVMTKARSELKETIGKRKVEESDIARLPYLEAIIKETLRLHPPAPLLLPRKALSNVEIGGFTIQEDSLIFVNAWAIGRDPLTWENPTSFLPERFLFSKHDFKRQHGFDLIPFGAGQRTCPGLPLASRMVHLMLASLLHSFAWELPDGMAPEDIDMSAKFGTTLKKRVPLRVIPAQEQW
ncbi:geraniol 8-hydroxylase-like protein [Cinnamomum micranthum f. kanehirae]|uniref:Geraniol 8-hydroxylase-like protein n=1 Tax=Cinnamomum micranthum f. kanehirae TaxID=337451 RepID=A0A443P9W1_9MAGN|nr:geraniol 8-hydroxylase-like protein [Cinnamomum micranthum f. kanehirae]